MSSTDHRGPRKQLTTRVSDAAVAEIEAVAAGEQRSVSQVARNVLEQWARWRQRQSASTHEGAA